jgi:hypothetical protein
MANSYMKPWLVILVMAQAVSAIIATGTDIFIFKIGVAAIGSIILSITYFNQLMKVLDIWVVILAFVCSMMGDYFLSHMSADNSMFIIGISLYLTAHVGYLIFSLLNGAIRWKVTTLIAMAFLIFYYLTLYPNILDKTLAFTVLFYLLVSCVSLGAAMGIKAIPNIKTPYLIGIALILFSDTIISLKEFISYDSLNFLILPTYYLAQIFITIALYNKSKDYRIAI